MLAAMSQAQRRGCGSASSHASATDSLTVAVRLGRATDSLTVAARLGRATDSLTVAARFGRATDSLTVAVRFGRATDSLTVAARFGRQRRNDHIARVMVKVSSTSGIRMRVKRNKPTQVESTRPA